MERKTDKTDFSQLIADCLLRKRKAQNQLFKQFYDPLFAICMRFANNADDAKDMLAEGFLKIFSNLGKYENSGSFEAWLKRIMINSALDYQRKYEKFETQLVDYEKVIDIKPLQTENDAISKISSQELIQLIQQLPPTSKNVFNLYVFEGFSHAEIAQMLNIKEGTSHWHLNFARTTLKEKILKHQ